MERWITSDTHFGHDHLLTLHRWDQAKTLIRPGFTNVKQMDEKMIEGWNSVVKPNDEIYHLGDFSFRSPGHMGWLCRQLNGRKFLIMGNHDAFSYQHYREYFCGVGSQHEMDGCLLTHYPVHPEVAASFYVNAHGHIHNRYSLPPPYFNVCVEVSNYQPVSWETIKMVGNQWKSSR